MYSERHKESELVDILLLIDAASVRVQYMRGLDVYRQDCIRRQSS